MGTLKIGSASNRAGVTIEPSTVLFNGDNVKYIKNGLIEIWTSLKPLVPIMTSDTTPSGEAFASSVYDNIHRAWKAFNGTNKDSDDCWHISGTNTSGYIGYKFTIPTCVESFSVTNRNKDNNIQAPKTIQLQGSNDNSTWVNIGGQFTNPDGSNVTTNFTVNNKTAYLNYRLNIIDSHTATLAIGMLQFYGTQLKALVPPMTSNTTPSGEAFASSEYSSSAAAWCAFDGDDTTHWYSNDAKNTTFANIYIGYKFVKATKCNVAYIKTKTDVSSITFTIQGSNDGSEWSDLTEELTINAPIDNFIMFNNDNYYKMYKFNIISQKLSTASASSGGRILTLQFYK